ncbi:hypothetical protein SOM26_06170 [Sphingomonas sp. CFBP8993]|nr:hypothetical protein [Sphingomonas sp. CFBP8993]
MMQRPFTNRTVGVIAIALVSAATGYAVGRSSQHAPEMYRPRTAEAAVIARSREDFGGSPIVQDAIRRWTPKNGGTVEKAMSGYQVQVVDTPSMSCVKFAAIAYDVGGEPTYCYNPRTAQLVWENSNVE